MKKLVIILGIILFAVNTIYAQQQDNKVIDTTAILKELRKLRKQKWF